MYEKQQTCMKKQHTLETNTKIPMSQRLNQVAMAPHDPILCHKDTHHLRQAFQAPPEPWRPNFRPQTNKKQRKTQNEEHIFNMAILSG